MTWFGIVARGSPDITHASVASVTRLRRQKKNVINSVRAAVLHGYHADTLINEYFQPRLDASRAVTNYTVVTRSLTPLDICSNPILSNIRPLEDGKTHLSKQGDKNETSVMIR